MASTQISGSTLSLQGAPNKTDRERNNSNSLRTGILVRLNDQVIRDLQQCAHGGKAVQLLGGKTPKIRYGAKLLELNVRPETFRHEIYSTNDNNNHLDFTAFVSHHAELRVPVEKKAQEDSAGAEAALETLKQSLASMAKQKEERKTTISSSVTAGGKNSRYLQPSSRPTSLAQRSASSSSTPRPTAPTSAPSDPHAQAREKGMRFALIHLLAVRPLSEQDIHQKTHIPKAQLSSLLPRIADKQGLTWELSNKPYKELDPWSFKYTSDQRTLAIDNAIRAFDRARIPKDDKVWQILLPKEERNKGKILSRLHLTAERADLAGTPGLASTPIHTSAAATPKLGSIGTPRSGSGATATGRSAAGISIEKRLKEAKKKGAMEKKKQEKEAKEAAAAASDRESKPRNVTAKRLIPPKKVASKVKSDEVVHSSDDEEEGEVKEDSSLKKSTTTRKDPPKAAPRVRPEATERRDSSASEAPGLSKDSKIRSKPLTSDKSVANAASRKDSAISKVKPEAPVLSRAAVLPKKPEDSTAANAATKSKESPAQKPVKTTSTTQRSNISPRRLTDTKPKVPSPLGTSPPRNASDNAEKINKQMPKPSATANAAKAVKPAPTSKASEPLSFFGGVKTNSQSKIVTKKRPLESDTESVEPARKAVKSTASTPAKAPTSTLAKASSVNGTGKEAVAKAPPASSAASDRSLKRKANDLSSGLHDHAAPPSSKHRKTDSGSTHSHTATSSSGASLTTAPTVSPHSSPAGSEFSDDNLAGILNDDYEGGSLTWEQTRAAAETFRSKLYPEYLKLYRRIEQTPSDKVAKEDTVRLWQLHNRLEAIKHRIEVACRNGDKGGD
ncbi:uncharacterized protein M437DRAFT_35922 [Aureobasidium melanogenum CBS 110374]|uniref:Uncharacterized protein n=1 Tax=Aureobasidium melanogenum (strain CBS 110374) TaxID=1043003 RepID=A0A074W6Q2_AURM1|nr:uncharacterized protein M437DRAFT_35922 [Aureobasidium melanogenum CBS 110374]KEQ67244.1 hypothetical protein M437DRAFT_35922 [Aureobasidium melanogenum CBS 110374]